MSVDYTLAPEGPFPRALDECVMAYAWALQNTDKLGTHQCSRIELLVAADDEKDGFLWLLFKPLICITISQIIVVLCCRNYGGANHLCG